MVIFKKTLVPVLWLGTTLSALEYHFGHLGSGASAMCPCSLLAGERDGSSENQRRPWWRPETAMTLVCYWCYLVTSLLQVITGLLWRKLIPCQPNPVHSEKPLSIYYYLYNFSCCLYWISDFLRKQSTMFYKVFFWKIHVI